MRAIRVLAAARARSRIICLNGADGTSAPRASGDARQMRSYCLSRAVGTFRAPRMGRRARRPTAPPRCSSPPYVSAAQMARSAPRAWGDAPGLISPRIPICGARSADPGFSGRAERLASPESAQSSSSQNRRHWSRFGQGIRLPRTSGRRLGRGQPPACLARSAPVITTMFPPRPSPSRCRATRELMLMLRSFWVFGRL